MQHVDEKFHSKRWLITRFFFPKKVKFSIRIMSCVKKFKFFSKNIVKTKNELGFSFIEIHVKSMIPFRDDQGYARTERLGVTKSKAQIDNVKARLKSLALCAILQKFSKLSTSSGLNAYVHT